jgi:hypothetical protein
VTFQADATQCPGQFGGVDELPPAFFASMEADVDVRNQYPHCFALIQTSAFSPQLVAHTLIPL